jgi:hypothetical protein
MSNKPSTPEEYVALVRQAIDELEDIVEALGFDVDEIDGTPMFVEVLLKELRDMAALPDQPDPPGGSGCAGYLMFASYAGR